MTILVCLLLIILIGLYLEICMIKKYRKNIHYIIHVNGVRGKSSVVRMLDAAFRINDYTGIAKTTGSEPSYIDEYGNNKIIKRYAPANIREQIRTMRMASNSKCDYLILECMAVDPKLQWYCEKIIEADITIITNVRLDHIGVLGYNLEEIGQSLLMSKPQKGILFTDYHFKKIDESHILKKIFVKESDGFTENLNMSLTVCEYMKFDLEKSIQAMKNFKGDIGHQEYFELEDGIFINGFSANDFQSTKMILDKYYLDNKYSKFKKAVILNNRQDRPFRSDMMINLIASSMIDKIYIAGDSKRAIKRKLLKIESIENKIELVNNINDICLSGYMTIGIGNIKGFGITLLEELQKT